MSEYLPASHEAFKSAPDTSTLRGIVQATEMWLVRDESVPTVELVVGCQYIAFQLEKARDDTEYRFASKGEAGEGFALGAGQSIEAYEQLHDIILSLAEYVDDGKRRAAKTCLAELKGAMSLLEKAQEALGNWSRQPQLRCPSCGGSQGDPCPTCELELLYLEPEIESNIKAASFSKEYGTVFKVYSQVVRGEVTLSKVFASLEPLKRNLRSTHALVRSSSVDSPDSQVLLELQDCLDGTLSGITQMELSGKTRRMIDLRAGWYQVFENGLRFKELRERFLQEFGRPLIQQEQRWPDGLE